MRAVEKIHIQNFRSIRDQDLHLGRLNVFIGGNGAGKSNLIQAFQFLREIVQKNLSQYSLVKGADNLLHYGRKKSPFMRLSLEFLEGSLSNEYEIRLSPTDEGALIVNSEHAWFHDRSRYRDATGEQLSSGSREAAIGNPQEGIASYVQRDMLSYRLYHFHDTGDSAAVKAAGPLDDNRFLRSDAANLAAFLYYLRKRKAEHFQSIEEAIRQVAPFFERFNLEPSPLNPEQIRLEWKEPGSDAYFNAGSLSDGTLRFMCLATLLLQPQLPAAILLDEPEMGLHPSAIRILTDLLTAASVRTQVLVATQSVTLLNNLEPEQVWTVERMNGESVFRHLSGQDMTAWLEDYALGDLWEKNVIGARP